jgi:hypothetical protein
VNPLHGFYQVRAQLTAQVRHATRSREDFFCKTDLPAFTALYFLLILRLHHDARRAIDFIPYPYTLPQSNLL